MATNLWRGDAAAVAQVDTITPGSVAAGRKPEAAATNDCR